MSDVKFPLAVRNPGRRWYQYSLRSVLILVALSAIPCSWLAVKLQQKAASMMFTLRTESGGMTPPSEATPPSVVVVRARAGDAIGTIGKEWRRSGSEITAPFTVVEIFDKDRAKIRVGEGLQYSLWSDEEERRNPKTYCATTDNEVVVLGRGVTLEAWTMTMCAGERYTLSVSDASE
jgi:hypothetical protein